MFTGQSIGLDRLTKKFSTLATEHSHGNAGTRYGESCSYSSKYCYTLRWSARDRSCAGARVLLLASSKSAGNQ